MFISKPYVYLHRNHKQNSNKMRKAVNITETRLQQIGLGRVDKKEMVTTNMIAIDNYGQMPSSSFIKKLVDKGRLDWSYRSKAAHFFTNEFLTDLLNKNIDLFEPQF